jgi:hypothetical protein
VRLFHECRRGWLFHQRLRERGPIPVDSEQVAMDGDTGRFELIWN